MIVIPALVFALERLELAGADNPIAAREGKADDQADKKPDRRR